MSLFPKKVEYPFKHIERVGNSGGYLSQNFSTHDKMFWVISRYLSYEKQKSSPAASITFNNFFLKIQSSKLLNSFYASGHQ